MGKLSFHVKFVQTDGWTDRWTDNGKTKCPDLSMQGHKKCSLKYNFHLR